MSSRILVVDDEDVVRGVIAQVLAEDDHEVVEARNAEEALRLYREENFPLVITDIYMGKMTGLDLLQEVKVQNEDALVVVITSNASLETATTALRAGAYDYLTKPFEDIDLISAVAKRALDRIRLTRDNKELIERQRRYAEELERLNARLGEMATRDGLTGLYNHRYFRDTLKALLAHEQRGPISLIFADIDSFKHYNDTHGHLRGDDLLVNVSRILQDHAQRQGAIASRYGGEEFVLLVPKADHRAGHHIAEGIREAVSSHPFHGRDSQPMGSVTISLGVSSTVPSDPVDAATLIDRADKALYRAKRGGRNAVCLSEEAVPVE